jgi:energy-coupling factor transporter ATP-binding protein EcfA2
MGTKSKQKQKRPQAKWNLGASQMQMVTGIVKQQQTEIAMIQRHHNRELLATVATLRDELKIPKETKLGLDMQNPAKMFVREITEDELRKAASQMQQQTNGDKPPSAN